MSFDFLSIGDTQLDTIMVLAPDEVEVRCELDTHDEVLVLDYASKLPVSELHNVVAGNAANTAVTGARLGAKTAFWTLLGDDRIADEQLLHFRREGIVTAWAQKVPGARSNQSTVISVSGERTILVYHAPRVYTLPEQLPPARWVYLTSMATGSEAIFPDLVAYCQRTKAKLAYQPGTFQLRLGAEASRQLLAVTEVILMNKEEAQLYTGRSSNDLKQLIAELRGLGPRIAVVTDGTNGSVAGDGTELWQMGIRPEVPRVEATGAGDAYSSAFVLALLHDQSIGEALRWGALNAEGVIQKLGPQAGILRKEELERQLVAHPDFAADRS